MADIDEVADLGRDLIRRNPLKEGDDSPLGKKQREIRADLEKQLREYEKDKGPRQGRLDIDDAEQKNREANRKSSIQDLRDLREGKIDNQELKERVRARGGAGGAGVGDVGIKGIGKKSKLDFAKGGKVKSASARADGCAIRGKTRA